MAHRLKLLCNRRRCVMKSQDVDCITAGNMKALRVKQHVCEQRSAVRLGGKTSTTAATFPLSTGFCAQLCGNGGCIIYRLGVAGQNA